MANVTLKPKTLADLDTIFPGFAQVWREIKKDTGTKKRCPSFLHFTTTPSKMMPGDAYLGRRYALDLRTMKLSEGLHVSGGEWACHAGSNNDQAIKGVPDGAAVLSCEWNDYYGVFTIDIQVAENAMPKQIGA
jgi:hypothetical protein